MNRQNPLFRSFLYFPLRQAFIVGLAGLWIAFSLIQQTRSVLYSPLLRSDGLIIYAFSIPITTVGVLLPLLFVIWLCLKVKLQREQAATSISIYRALKIVLDGNAGIALLYICLYAPLFILLDAFRALSVVPLTTPVCGLIGVGVGIFLFRRINARDKLTLLALLLSLTLATEYMDWNDRKPLLRDARRIRVGMTGADVEALMTNHKIGPGGPILNNLESETEGELHYMTPHSSDMVTVTVNKGKVQDAVFLAD